MYHQRKGQQIQKKTLYQPLTEVFAEEAKKMPLEKLTEEKTFFLDERYFVFYRFDIVLTSKKPFTIQSLRKIIDEKLHIIKKQDMLTSPRVLHDIKHILVDNKQVSFLFGHTGILSFSLHLSLLNQEGVAVCSLLGGDKVFTHPKISLYPRNFFLLHQLTQQVKKEDYAFLCIYEENTELLVVKQWRYDHIHYLNMGTQVLKSCYQEQDVEKYFYTDRKLVTKNPFLSKLIDEAISFFTDNLCHRLYQYVPSLYDIIVVGDIIKNPSFLSVFQDSYKAFGTGYILPFLWTKSKSTKKTTSFVSPHILAYQMMRKKR